MQYPSFLKGFTMVLLLLLTSTFNTFAHEALPDEDLNWICNYYGETSATGQLRTSAASSAANTVISHIMSSVGLKPRFEVRSSNVPNAAAVIYGDKRYILYNQKFITLLQRATHTDWSAISILAHEIGHHLNGHTLEKGGSKPGNELEADEFSGFVLRKMGASLKQAQAAIAIMPDKTGSHTHPPQQARLKAIAQGWLNADAHISSELAADKSRSISEQDVYSVITLEASDLMNEGA